MNPSENLECRVYIGKQAAPDNDLSSILELEIPNKLLGHWNLVLAPLVCVVALVCVVGFIPFP